MQGGRDMPRLVLKSDESAARKEYSLDDVMKILNVIKQQNSECLVVLNKLYNSNSYSRDSINDAMHIILKNVDDIKNSMDDANSYDELTGKRIYEIRQKTNMSWNRMVQKYQVPKSTLQYRYRQYKKKLVQMSDLDDYE